MTLDDALTLSVGRYVTSPHMYEKSPLRLTEVWVNDKRTIVMCRIGTVAGTTWLDLTGYDLPPKSLVWDRLLHEWITKQEMARRKAARKAA